MFAFIPNLFCVKTERSDHVLQSLMKSLQGTLTLRMVSWWLLLLNVKFINDLLKYSEHKIWSLIRLYSSRKTYKCKNITRAFGLIFLSWIASGKCVEAHMIVKRYWQRDFVLGREYTQSIMILQKGTSKAEMGCKWAFGIIDWVFLPFDKFVKIYNAKKHLILILASRNDCILW